MIKPLFERQLQLEIDTDLANAPVALPEAAMDPLQRWRAVLPLLFPNAAEDTNRRPVLSPLVDESRKQGTSWLN